MKIGLIGAGRLGLCFALLVEKIGYTVVASDVREDYIKDLRKGVINTTEPDVHDLLLNSKNITFTTNNLDVIEQCDIIFTLVATPSLEDGSYDVSAVDKVVQDFTTSSLKLSGKSLIIGCTTNPGDCEKFQKRLDYFGVDVFYNPEFIAQGSIIKDLKNADMVLIGGHGHHVSELEKIYYGIKGSKKETYPYIHSMSTKAAEITKIAVNCYLTTKISYANQVGQVLALAGMEDEIDNVLTAIGTDSRIGNKYLKFGFGFGGPCFPRDNRAFAAYAKDLGVCFNLGETIDNFNTKHSDFLLEYYVSKNINKLPFCFKYLTYKSGIDIITESRQYDLALSFLNEGYEVYCIDNACKNLVDDRIKFVTTPIENVYWIDL